MYKIQDSLGYMNFNSCSAQDKWMIGNLLIDMKVELSMYVFG